LLAVSLVTPAEVRDMTEEHSALFQTLLQLGGSFGLALTTVISASYQTKALKAGRPAIDALLSGLHAAFWLGAGASFGALLLALVMLRSMGTYGKGGKKEPAKAEEQHTEKAVGDEKV